MVIPYREKQEVAVICGPAFPANHLAGVGCAGCHNGGEWKVIGAALITLGIAMAGGGILLGQRYTPRSAMQLLGFKVVLWLGVALALVGFFVVIV